MLVIEFFACFVFCCHLDDFGLYLSSFLSLGAKLNRSLTAYFEIFNWIELDCECVIL